MSRIGQCAIAMTEALALVSIATLHAQSSGGDYTLSASVIAGGGSSIAGDSDQMKPGMTLNGSMKEDEKARVLARLALSGRVPVKATSENGAIRAGDLLVSSSRPGHAMRAPDSPRAGTVIGKAMQKLDQASGEIAMLVMLR